MSAVKVDDTKARPPGWADFVDRYAHDAALATWLAALGLIERAVVDAREVSSSRWRYYPQGELRRLRRDLLPALLLARAAVAMQSESSDRERELSAELRAEAEQAAARRRREQTLPAERARLAKAAKRRQERERGQRP